MDGNITSPQKSLSELIGELAEPQRLYRSHENKFVRRPMSCIERDAPCLEYFSMAARWSEAAIRLKAFLSQPAINQSNLISSRPLSLIDARSESHPDDQARLTWEMQCLIDGVARWADRITESQATSIESLREVHILPSHFDLRRLDEIQMSLGDAKQVLESVNGRWGRSRWFTQPRSMPVGLGILSSLAESATDANETYSNRPRPLQEHSSNERITYELSPITSAIEWPQKPDAAKIDDYPWRQNPNNSTLWLVYMAAAYKAQNLKADSATQAHYIVRLLNEKSLNGITPDDYPFLNIELVDGRAAYAFDDLTRKSKLSLNDIRKRLRDHREKVDYLCVKLRDIS